MASQIEASRISLPRRVAAKARALSRTNSGSQLWRNTLAGGASAIVGAIISAISYPVYLHFLGYEQYGLWLAISVVLSFATFGHLGLASAVATTVAQENARGDISGIRQTVSTALLVLSAVGLVAVAGILVCGGSFISALHLRPELQAEARMLLPFTALLSLYVVQIDTINSVLVGLGRLDLAVGTQQSGRLMTLIFAAALLSAGVGVISLPIATLTGNVYVHLRSLHLARRIAGQPCFSVSAFSIARLRSLLTFGSAVLASTVINFLLGPLNKFALTRYVGPSSVPIYDLAFTMTMQIRGVLDSGLSSLMPEVSRLKALASNEARVRIHSVYSRAMKLIFQVGLPIFGGAMLAAQLFLHLWLGARFRPELVPALRILLVGGFVSLLGVPGYHLLLGVRSAKSVVAANILQGGVNAAVLGCLCCMGALSPLSTAAAASAGIAAGGAFLVFASRTRISDGFQPAQEA